MRHSWIHSLVCAFSFSFSIVFSVILTLGRLLQRSTRSARKGLPIIVRVHFTAELPKPTNKPHGSLGTHPLGGSLKRAAPPWHTAHILSQSPVQIPDPQQLRCSKSVAISQNIFAKLLLSNKNSFRARIDGNNSILPSSIEFSQTRSIKQWNS